MCDICWKSPCDSRCPNGADNTGKIITVYPIPIQREKERSFRLRPSMTTSLYHEKSEKARRIFMNSKNIAKAIKKKIDNWISCVDDESIAKTIAENCIVTGGALVSMLNGEPPNDFDVYFKTKKAVEDISKYYANKWNDTHKDKSQVEIESKDDRIRCFIRSSGVTSEEELPDGETEPYVEDETKEEKPKYRPRFFSTNAISLSDKIQIVIRFYGSVDEIHTNYDFVHCTCSYDYSENSVNLPSRALEAIINKELFYVGSKYPLCSIIRARKFIERGWHINAGQYLKMCLQLNELDLKDLDVFKDQLTGVDSLYFEQAIKNIKERQEKEPDFKPDNTYLFDIINKIF